MQLLPSPEPGGDGPGGVVERWYHDHAAELVRLARFALGRRNGAEELVQDLFADLYRKPPALDDPGRPLPYLRSAVFNRARSRHRSRASRDRAHLRVAGQRPDPGVGVEDRAVTAATRQTVLDALETLPTRQREVVILRYWLDLSEKEIAETLGISPGTVKSSASRAMKALAPALEALR